MRLACRSVFVLAILISFAAPLQAELTIEPLTWNIIGLDSNDPLSGPNRFPVGARVCSDVATTNVSVQFVWDSINPYIDLRPGSLSTINLASIGAGDCADAYFEVEVDKDAAAFDTAREYHITATDFSGTVSTPTPRELYVEFLISQARNEVTDVLYGPDELSLTSVAPGGSLALVVGNTYTIQLVGGTATQGYNQFEAFINFSNTVFQILDVETTYSADNSPYVNNPSDKLYADACLWENDPNDPQYRECVGGDFKTGGSNVVTTYTIKIIGGGGTNETLTTLLYDFSGSSFHYNADFGADARIATIIDPTTATISKSFSPNPTAIDGLSVLKFTLTNPNGGTLSGYNFVDNLPANLEVAATPGVTTSGCGTPTVTALAGSSTISFSNGTLAANGNCLVTVNVTPTTTGTFNNTTNNLFIDAIDTGDNAFASLTANTDTPGTGICGVMAAWTFPSGFSITSPAPTTDNVTGTPSAAPGDGIDESSFTEGTNSWGSNGDITTGATLVTADEDYLEFTLDTTGYTNLTFSFAAARKNTPNSPQGLAVYAGTSSLTRDNVAGNGPATDPGTQVLAPNATALPTGTTAFTSFGPLSLPDGTTHVRIYFFNSGNQNNGSDIFVDNVSFSGCTMPIDPTISKSFSPDPIAVNGTSTLTFTLGNTNSTALTGAAFTDTLPAGLQVAATPTASTTCAGATWAPTAGATTLTFSGGTIPASGSCTVTVNVTATTGGPHGNVSGFLSTTESGTANDTVATDTLTAVLPPVISKQFSPSPIISGGISTLTFIIQNPNQDNALSGVAFTDTFPVAPGAMTVATPANATTSGCGAPTFSPVSGAGSISFSGGTIAAGGTCVVTVDVTASATGTYSNTSGTVSHVVNAQTVNGNTASDSLEVDPASPAISLLKQIGPSNAGPWTSFLVTTGQVWYRFTVENTGDVPLDPVTITDDQLDVTACNTQFAASAPLPAPVAGNDDHIIQCILGPFTQAGPTFVNTATATGTYSGNPVTSDPSSATMAVPGLTLDKTAAPMTFTSAGENINYSYLVTNSGAAPLEGPVTVADDKATVTCPAVTTVGDLDNFLDPGESITCTATYVITASDVTNAGVTNTATATVEGVNSNPDSVTVALNTAADVSVTKTLVSTAPFSVGETIEYSVTVANAGPVTATGIQVTDTPTNLTITSVTGACASLPCTIASLASGANTAITIFATIDEPGAFDNSIAVDANEPDPDLTDNTDDDGNGGTAGLEADVSLVKTLTTAGPFLAGQSISYTLLIENDGPSTATSIDVTDAPTNLTITGVSGACAALPCTIASLASGANTSITVTATIIAAGTFDNSATATADETDPNPINNTDDDGNDGTAGPAADVSLDKSLVTAGPYFAGQSISYTLLIENDGPSTATSIDVSDTPANLTITGVSGACAALPCTIASLVSGASTSITVTATIGTAGSFDNSATAVADEPDPVPANNTDDTGNGANVLPSADVSLVKTLTTVGPYTAGQSITYTLQIANAGPSTATSIDVTDTPANLTITNVSGACAALPCTIASLASGANTSITVTATINASGAFDNAATALADENDPNPDNNTDDDDNNGLTGVSADVSIVKTLTTAGPYSAGQSISYSLQIANAGPSTATSIQVTDTPTNLTITNVSGACAALPCTIASLASGANTSITVTATITAAGTFDNAATANATEPDPDPDDNTDDVGNDGQAGPSADVSIVKTLTTAGPYTVGQSISYSLQIANAGPSTATSIQVTDTPTNLTITGVSGACAALPCTIASLASGANTSITVTATIDAAGAFDNVATANADEPDPDSTDNTDDDGNDGTAGASADVSIVKTLTTAGPFTAGQSISYSLQIANAGPSTATSIQVTDTPTNLTITGVSGACASLPCTIASLASGANTSITVTATITAAGAFDNVATANAAESDPDPTDNTDDEGNDGTAAASADVSIVKTLTSAGPFTAGQSISYTLFVANAGPSTATLVQIADTPTNLTITNVSGACSGLPCTLASLASGADATIIVTATIDADGAFDNVATANATESDPNSENNTDSDGNDGIAGPSADVSIVKTLTTVGPYSAGQSISYSLQIANAGPSTATSIQVTDTPTNLTITNVSGACAALPCTIASLASGANTSITVTATINAAGAFDNVATANATEPDPDPADNTDADDNNGLTGVSADVSIVKTLVTTGPFIPGQTVNYTLFVANAGPSPATNIQVTDTPTHLTITGVSGACAALPCTVASLAVGADATINVSATINAAGAFDNVATANAAEPDPDPDDNTDADGNNGTAAASADVSIVKTLVTAGPYTAGQSISYSLQIANAGPSTATNIQVTDTPTNLTITGVSGACASLPCTIASLASGANTSITVTATIDAAGAFDNAATANATESDPDPADNTDDDNNGGDAAPSADVSIVKTLTTAGPYSAGQSITYTLVVANAGPSPATNIQVTDTPSNLTITGVSGACAALPCTIASLAVGADTTINVTATIDAAGAFDNVATAIGAESDPNLTDNTDDSGNNGLTGVSADVSIVKTLVTGGPFVPGQSVNYTLVVANAGPSPATNVQVTDTPTNLTITGVSGACAALPCTIASLAVGADATINVAATIDAAGAFDNVATANATEPDPNPDNNTDDDGNDGTAAGAVVVDLAIVKTASAPTITVGDSFDFILTVTNNGPPAATNVTVNDPLPANFELQSATSTQGTCSGTTTVTCSIGTMGAGDTVTITITGRPTEAGPMPNTATVDADETEPVLTNNTSSVTPVAATAPAIPTATELGLLVLAAALAALGVRRMIA